MTDENKKSTLVILAAGMGSRYGGLKQLDPVGPNGEAILDYSVYDAARAGFTKVVFIIRKDFEEQFREQVTDKYKGHIDVEYVFQDIDDLPQGYERPAEREKPWGTAHAMLSAKSAVNEPFAVINADDFYGAEAFETLHSFLVGDKINDKQYAMVGFRLSNTLSENGSVARGICAEDAEANLTSVEELLKIYKTADGAEDRPEDAVGNVDQARVRKLTGEEPVSMNMWAFTPNIFDTFAQRFIGWLDKNLTVPKSEYLIPTEVDELIHEGLCKVEVLKTDSKWFGVTYREDKPMVQQSIRDLIDAGKYPERLF